jgi:hypothetical protein
LVDDVLLRNYLKTLDVPVLRVTGEHNTAPMPSNILRDVRRTVLIHSSYKTVGGMDWIELAKDRDGRRALMR